MNDVRLYNGDALEVLKGLEPGSVDAVVTDPPYGLGGKWKCGCWKKARNGRSKFWTGETPSWDKGVNQQAVDLCIGLGKPLIVWGGNYYNLPPKRGWLVWDKMQKHSGSECELAWTNLDIPVRVFRMSRIDAYFNKADQPKTHPNEKPLALMLWCLSFLPDDCTVLDPFMGSGTTGVACVQTGRRFVGCEIDPGYYEIACKRIEEARNATPLFAEALP